MRIRHALFGLLVACQTPQHPDRAEPTKPTPTPKPTESAPVGSAKVVAVPMPIYAASAQPIPLEQVPAPWTLTASDGSGLLATRVEAKAVVQGPLAFTELHLHFANTEDRVREGTFAITLPAGAAVSRFAMENNGQWMEAEVVEKQMARRAYEDFLHRKQDPALMEKAEGNQFTARVFPIPAKGTKHLVLSFSQELPGERYVLPLRGLPKVERVDVSLDVTNLDGSRVQQVLAERNWQPDRDFVSTAPAMAEAVSSGHYVVAQLSPFDQATVAKDVPKAITLLVDTSASRALGFARYANNVREMIATVASKYQGTAIEVVAFDQDTQSIYTGPASGFGSAQVDALVARGAAGASDLSQALGKVAGGTDRVVIVTDGVLTAGTEGAALEASIKALSAKKVERVDVVLSGGIRDAAVAKSLVTAGLARTGAVVDLDQSIGEVAAAIGERVMSDIAVSVEGASWVYPRVIESARPNQRVMVYAQLDKPAQTMTVKIGSSRRTVGTLSGTPALIERATAAAEIADLETALESATPGDATQLKATIAKKAIAARVISSQTSMLVLESEGDYARYGIDRNSLADILVVGPMGIEQLRRSAQIAAKPAVPTPTKLPAQKPQLAKSQDKGDELDSKAKPKISGNRESDNAGMPAKEMPAPDLTAAVDELEKNFDGELAKRAAGPASEADPSAPPPAPPPPPPPGTTGRAQPAPRIERAERREVATVSGDYDAYLADDSPREQWPPPNSPAPLKGTLAQIDRLLKQKNVSGALAKAEEWHAKNPGDVLALIGMGEALEASKDLPRAARMYGSIIDLFPARADLRRFAGERLERIGEGARSLAIDTYKRAARERPDHLTGHRLLAYAHVKAGNFADAFAAILASIDRDYPSGRFEGGERILRDDAGLIGAAYAAALPAKRDEIVAALSKRNLSLPKGPSTRFIMYWETDANDVDFHIQDARGGHAWYSNKTLPSGGELYADVTTGYGPECFAIEGTPKAGPYKLSINYYSQGPMGYGMGLLQIVKHDGRGKLTFQDRPYVIMADHAYVDLGTFR